jgi:hypothetical protein
MYQFRRNDTASSAQAGTASAIAAINASIPRMT